MSCGTFFRGIFKPKPVVGGLGLVNPIAIVGLPFSSQITGVLDGASLRLLDSVNGAYSIAVGANGLWYLNRVAGYAAVDELPKVAEYRPEASGPVWSGVLRVSTIIVVALAITGVPFAAQSGVAYSFIPAVTGGYGPRSFALTGPLPAGLTFSPATGAISGTPTVQGTFSGLSITATDQTGSAVLGPLVLLIMPPGYSPALNFGNALNSGYVPAVVF